MSVQCLVVELVELNELPINYEWGDISESGASCIVNPVNCVGVMGRGVAKQIKKKFPWSVWPYEQICNRGEFVVGKIIAAKLSIVSEVSLKPPTIIHVATKNHWRGKSKLDWVESCLISINEFILSNSIEDIAIPKLGCGLGGLDWSDVEELFNKYLDLNSCVVTIYDLEAKKNNAGGIQKMLPLISEEE